MTALPPGWAETTLGSIADWGSGGTPRATDPAYYGGEIPWAVIGDLNDAVVSTTSSTITAFGLNNSSAKLVEPGTLLVAMYGSIGKLGIAGKRMATNQAIAFAHGHRGVADNKFLFWFLRWQRSALASAGKGATQKNISQTLLKAWPIGLPPLAEQERIVAAIEEQFSRVDKALSSLRTAIERLRALRVAALSRCDLETWPRKRWADVGTSKNGRAFPSRDYSDEGVRLLRPGNLHVSGRVEWTPTNTRHLPDRYAEEFPSYLVGPGAVVINLTAQSLKDEFLGRVCLTSEGGKWLLNQRIARLSPGPDIEPRFLLYALKSPRFRRFVDSLNTGSLIQHMFTNQIDDYEVPVPTRDEQLAAIENAEEQLSLLDAVDQAVSSSVTKAQLLRRSTLNAAFSGVLVPQDPNDESAASTLAQFADHGNGTRTSRLGEHS